MKRMTWLFTGVLLLLGQPVWAARMPVHDAAESQEYGRKFGGMIGRGALNALTCFVDVLVNVVNETKAGPPVVGTLTGVAKGAGCGVLRLGSGAIDLVTFWVPGFNGFPVSDSYDNCLATTSGSAAEMEQPQPTYTQTSGPIAVSTSPSGASPAPAEQPATTRTWKK